MQLSEDIRKKVILFQQTEITEYHIYKRLAQRIKSQENAKILDQIAEVELRHYNGWKKFTNEEVQPRWYFVWFYYLISIIFGFTFGVKLMEQGEEAAQVNYAAVAKEIPEAAKYQDEEDAHEHQLIEMLDEERLQYAGSVVLGLNDALVELTGALAGLTLALQDVKLIALSGLITGIAASMGLFDLAAKYPKAVRSARGLGLMLGLELSPDLPSLPGDASKTQSVRLANHLHTAGVLTIPAGAQIIRLLPALNLSRAEAEEGLRILESVVAKLTD